MPLFDVFCKVCGNKRPDKYFPTLAASDEPQACGECGGQLEKEEVQNFQFADFKPFTTRNIRKDGKAVTVTSKSHLERLCRENHVRPHPCNDTVESKADPREIGVAIQEERKKFPARYRKIKEEVRALGIEEVTPIAQRAAATNRGEKRA